MISRRAVSVVAVAVASAVAIAGGAVACSAFETAGSGDGPDAAAAPDGAAETSAPPPAEAGSDAGGSWPHALLVIGGTDTSADPTLTSDIYMAPIDDDGGLRPWVTLRDAGPAVRSAAGGVVDGTIVIAGGSAEAVPPIPSATIYSISRLSDGGLAPLRTADASLPGGGSYSAEYASNGHALVVLGGVGPAGVLASSLVLTFDGADVQVAPATSLPAPRFNGAAGFSGLDLFVFGGQSTDGGASASTDVVATTAAPMLGSWIWKDWGSGYTDVANAGVGVGTAGRFFSTGAQGDAGGNVWELDRTTNGVTVRATPVPALAPYAAITAAVTPAGDTLLYLVSGSSSWCAVVPQDTTRLPTFSPGPALPAPRQSPVLVVF